MKSFVTCLAVAVAAAVAPGAASVAQEGALGPVTEPPVSLDPVTEPPVSLDPVLCEERAVVRALLACRDRDSGVAASPRNEPESTPPRRRPVKQPGPSPRPRRRESAKRTGQASAAAAAPRARAAAAGSVSIEDFSFQPASITVNVGESVTWTNADEAPHSATAEDGSFDTGTFGKSESRSHQFTEAGTFRYICTPHPSMKGTVRVIAAGNDAPPSDTDSDSEGPADDEDSGGGGSTDPGSTGSGAGEATDDSSEGGGSLPLTGAELGSLAALGLALTGVGVGVRRRTRRELSA